jgi:hypothetical protein
MKKRLVSVCAGIMVVILMATSLVACGGKKGEPVDYAGQYRLSSVMLEGVLIEGEELELNWPPADNYIEIIDSKNITFVLTGKRIDTTYSKNGSALQIEDTAGAFSIELGNNVLTYRDNIDAQGDAQYELFFTRK